MILQKYFSWFGAQEIFLIVIDVENSCLDSYFSENCNTFCSGIFDDVQKISIYLKYLTSVTL